MSLKEVHFEGTPPWGFRMNGGADAGHQLRISRVNPGSKAELKGVREGDLITSINGQSTKCLTNSESHALLRTVKENLRLGLNEEKNSSPRRRSKEIKSAPAATEKEQASPATKENTKPTSSKSRRQRKARFKNRFKEMLGFRETKGQVINLHPFLDGNTENPSASDQVKQDDDQISNLDDNSSQKLYDNFREPNDEMQNVSLKSCSSNVSISTGEASVIIHKTNQSDNSSFDVGSSKETLQAEDDSVNPCHICESSKDNVNEFVKSTDHSIQATHPSVKFTDDSNKVNDGSPKLEIIKFISPTLLHSTVSTIENTCKQPTSQENTAIEVVICSPNAHFQQSDEQNNVIVEHPDDICEETLKFLPSNDINELTVVTSTIDDEHIYDLDVVDLHTPLIATEDEANLRDYLGTLKLNSPEVVLEEKTQIICPPYPSNAQMYYYIPKRYLEVISEENSDLSDVDKPWENSDRIKQINNIDTIPEDWIGSQDGIDTSWRDGKSLEEVSDVPVVSDSHSDSDVLEDIKLKSKSSYSVKEPKLKVLLEKHSNINSNVIKSSNKIAKSIDYKLNGLSRYDKPIPSVDVVKNVVSSYYNSKVIPEPVHVDSVNNVIQTRKANAPIAEKEIELVYIDSSDSELFSSKSDVNLSLLSFDLNIDKSCEELSNSESSITPEKREKTGEDSVTITKIISNITETAKGITNSSDLFFTPEGSILSIEDKEHIHSNEDYCKDRRSSYPLTKADLPPSKSKRNRDSCSEFDDELNIRSLSTHSTESISSQSTAKHYYISNVLTLKELCSNAVLNLPYGLHILKQLGISYSDIEQYSGYIAEGSEYSFSSKHYLSDKELNHLYEDLENEPFAESVSNDFPATTDSQTFQFDSIVTEKIPEKLIGDIYINWAGIAVPNDSHLVSCLPKNQPINLAQTQKKASDLLDLHQKFIERRGYHENCTPLQNANEVEIVYLDESDSEIKEFLALQNYHKIRQQKMRSSTKEDTTLKKYVTVDKNAQIVNTEIPSTCVEFYKVDVNGKNSDCSTSKQSEAVGNSRLLELIQNLDTKSSSAGSVVNDQVSHQSLESQSPFDDMKLVDSVERMTEIDSENIMPKVSEGKKCDETEFTSVTLESKNECESHKKLKIIHKSPIKHKRPKSVPPAGEIFRRKMYEEYMDKLSELAQRRQLKVIKLSSCSNISTSSSEALQLESEFMDKVRERMLKLGIKEEEHQEKEVEETIETERVVEEKLPRHLRELMELTEECDIIGKQGLLIEIDQALSPEQKGFLTLKGVWSPVQTPDAERKKFDFSSVEAQKEIKEDIPEEQQPPIWTPRSAGASPTLERKFRSVNFQSPPPNRKEIIHKEEPELPKELPVEPTSQSRLVSSTSENSTLTSQLRLPSAQNPTITLLQKAREGHIPKGAQYLDDITSVQQSHTSSGDIKYTIKKEYYTEDEGGTKKIVELAPRKFDGIGPTTREGIPIGLRSEVKEDNQQKWYKRMYDSLHKAEHDSQYPYIYAGGYVSEPERLGYDSDASISKYATLDRRKIRNKENDFTTSTLPRNRYAPAVKHAVNIYKNQPGRIEDYEPGHSSIAETETKQWWDEVLDIFDGELNHQTKNQYFSERSPRSLTYALKDTGYESDSTLVFRRRENNMSQQSPAEQKMAYKVIQRGGEVPLHGLRKAAPERPKDDSEIEYFPISPTLTRIRVHKKAGKPQEKVYYPVTPEEPVFGTYKRTARSATIPSPPRRLSSRNNSTLKMITRISTKSPDHFAYSCDRTISNHPSKDSIDLNSKVGRIPNKIKSTLKKTDSNKHQFNSTVRQKKEILRKSPDLKAPAEVKKVMKESKSPDTVVKNATTLYSTQINKKPSEDKSLKVTVAISAKGKDLLTSSSSASSKSDVRKSSPILAKTNTNKPKMISSLKKLTGSTQSLTKLSRPSSRASTTSTALIEQPKKTKKEINSDLKKKKEKKPEVIIKNLDKIKEEDKKKGKKKLESSKKKNSSKKKDKENVPTENIPCIENEEDFRNQESNFFQHLLLRENSPSPTPPMTTIVATVHRTPSVSERAKKFSENAHTCYKSEPSLRNLNVYLSQKKPVSESRFRSLDRGRRALSPYYGTLDFFDKLDKFDKHNNVWDYSQSFRATPTYESIKGRSSSEPPCSSPSPCQDICDNLDVGSPSVSRSPSSRRIRRSTSKTIESIAGLKRKGRSKSLNEADRQSQMGSTSSLSMSHVTDHADYQSYVFELLHSTRKSARFKELHKFYSSLERMAELEKTTSNTDLRPRLKGEEVIDFDRWKQLRNKERAEAELNNLYQKLMGDQKEKDLLFQPKETVRWQGDRGLRNKEKSVEDLRQKFQKMVESSESDKKSIDSSTDVYKPLWRGNSVVNLAHSLTSITGSKRGRPVMETSGECNKQLTKPPAKSGKEIGSRLWSSLSMDQVNALKCQLSEIYSTVSNLKHERIQKIRQKIEDYEMNVSDLNPPDNLHVRSNSLLSPDQLYSPSIKRRDIKRQECMKADSIGAIPQMKPSKIMSEPEKKKISMSLSAEVKERIKKKKHGSLVIPRETLGAVAAIKGNKKTKCPSTSDASPRTCYSLLSDDSTDKEKSTVKNKDLLLVLTPKDQQSEVKKMVDDWGSKEYAKLIQTTSSSSSSASTVIHLGSKDDFKTAETKFNEMSQSSNDLRHLGEPSSPNRGLFPSQSYTDLKELFGEKQASTYATLPLKHIQKPFFNSSDSLTKSMSPDPMKYYRAYLSVVKAGDVRKLKEKFESYDDIYNLRKESPVPKMFQSDPDLTRDFLSRKGGELSKVVIKGQELGDVQWLRKRYEPRKVSPIPFKVEDRFMPHINVISKTASLQQRSHTPPPRAETNKTGNVERLKQQFEQHGMSLLGQMYTSTPEITELRDIAPYLECEWVAHRNPRSPKPIRRTSRKRPASASPIRQSILKNHDIFANQPFNPEIHRPVYRYQPDHELDDRIWQGKSWNMRPTVTFKEPLGNPIPTPPRDIIPRHRSQESPHRYVESEVNIHYRSPVRSEAKAIWPEDELAEKQAEIMRRIYQEQRRTKYLNELHDMYSRRHTDNFIPSQKSPIPLNRYDDFPVDVQPPRPRDRTPEPKLVARALYNFMGQTSRELSFRRGDIIYVRRQIDKNWYEGEHNAMIGLFPFNYVEIIPYDGIRTLPKKASEGQARAKFNFQAQTHLELSLVKGELVLLTRRVDENWFEGRTGNRKGIFPVSYVEVLVEPGERAMSPSGPVSTKPIVAPASHSVMLNGAKDLGQQHYQPPRPALYSSSSLPPQSKMSDISLVSQTLHIDTQSDPVPYRVLYNYRPQNDDELELKEGDVVYVMEKCDDGWYVGSLHRNGQFGTFPGNYVERIQ